MGWNMSLNSISSFVTKKYLKFTSLLTLFPGIITIIMFMLLMLNNLPM